MFTLFKRKSEEERVEKTIKEIEKYFNNEYSFKRRNYNQNLIDSEISYINSLINKIVEHQKEYIKIKKKNLENNINIKLKELSQRLSFYQDELEKQLKEQSEFKEILTQSILENNFQESILNNQKLFNKFHQLFIDSINHLGILKTTNILKRYGLKEEQYIHTILIKSIQDAQKKYLKRFITDFIRSSCLETFKEVYKREYVQIKKLKAISDYEIEQLELKSAVYQLKEFLEVDEQRDCWNHKLSCNKINKITKLKFHNIIIFEGERLEILKKYGYFKKYEIEKKKVA